MILLLEHFLDTFPVLLPLTMLGGLFTWFWTGRPEAHSDTCAFYPLWCAWMMLAVAGVLILFWRLK